MKLSKKLKQIERYPFHMPGHKRNAKFGIAGAEIDITEVESFDNLHNPDGVLKDIENRLATLYKSNRSFMMVNGSTGGILAAIHAVCKSGDTIIIARNCHKSVFNACYLLNLKVVYVEPEFDSECGYYTRVTQSALDEVTAANSEAKAVVITSPTYEGIISEVTSSLPIIVDAAHGAHLGIKPFPEYPQGDIVISSLHKTLPALTQTAVANIYNAELTDEFKKYLDIFETSSPSYVLMNSVDKCLDYIEHSGDEFKSYYNRVKELHSLGLKWLYIKHSDDMSKIVVSTARASIEGTDLAEALRTRFNIEVEAVLSEHVILMTSVADTEKAFDTLENALISIDRECDKKSFRKQFKKPPCANNIIEITDYESGSFTDLKCATGKLANEFVYAYPPDIPLIVPGEIITAEMADYINDLIEAGVNVISDSGNLPQVLTKEG
ncbi:MAG: aminotransferase class I/II-fold pyridoxal phosphate-dependent enzyme [Eubacterium sp.]|nr:aminotransferase class I/II-fold pyridoxal phosphate-dependent enzyme [Eubacterium sp.]